MTRTRYFIARFAQAFGYSRRNVRMSEAAAEMHLLREAEAVLGATIWQQVEPIDALSVEYWNLRKLIKEREELRDKIQNVVARVEQAHKERAELLAVSPVGSEELEQQRLALLADLEQHARDRDAVVAEAREVRRTHVGLKMKLEVLMQDASQSSEEIQKVKNQLDALRDRFTQLKDRRIQIGNLIEQGDAKIDEVDAQIAKYREARRAEASGSFQAIGDLNKQLSAYRAEIALLETKMRQLHAEIGRYISRNALHNPDCSKAAGDQRGLVDVMRALRRSIALNHRLAGTS